MKTRLLFPLIAVLFASKTSLVAAACKGDTVQDWTRCQLDDVALQDKAIAAALAKITSMLKSDPAMSGTTTVDLVRQSQLSWERYRDSICAAQGLAAAGPSPSYQLIAAECMLDLGKARLRQLHDLQRVLGP
jgi:uncharacterized protein YecT (DUF1311 family)